MGIVTYNDNLHLEYGHQILILEVTIHFRKD